MKVNQIRALALAALMVFSVFGMAGTAAAAGSTQFNVTPSSQSISAGDTTTFDVVVTNADNGVGSYEFSINLTNGSTADITDVELGGDPASATSNVAYGANNDSVDIDAALANTDQTGEVTVVTVTVEGTAAGSTDVEIGSNPVLYDEAGSGYTISGMSAGTLTVQSGPTANFQVTNDSVTLPTGVDIGTTFTADVLVNNTGDANDTQDVSYSLLNSNGTSVASGSTSVSLPANSETTVSFNVDTTGLDAGTYTFQASTDDATASKSIVVSSQSEGSIVVDVSEARPSGATSSSEDARVTLYRINADDTRTQINDDPYLTNEDGRTTFTGIRTTPDGVNYEIEVQPPADAQQDLFIADTQSVTLTNDDNAAQLTAVLRNDEAPQDFGLGSFNGDTISGDSSTLLANGEAENTVEFAVYTRTQNTEDPGVESDVEVTVSADNMSGVTAFYYDTDGDGTREVAQQITVTINENSPVDAIADVDGDGTMDDVSYETFEVSAANADADSLINPTRTENFTASTSDIEGASSTDPATEQNSVQYVLEGDEAITGEIVDQQGNPLEGATVWAAYDGSNQSLEFSQETFVNNEDEMFLVDTTDADGRYAIPGIAGDNTDVTVYVIAEGYNRQNLTDTSVDRFVAASDAEQTAGVGSTTENHDFVLTAVDVTLDYRVTLDAEDDAGNFVGDNIEMPTTSERDLQVTVEVKTQTQPDSEFTPIQDSNLVNDVEIDFSQTSPSVGTVGDDPLTTDASPAMTTFESAEAQGTTTIEAEVENGEGTLYNDTVTVETFGVGSITGQVRDQNRNPIFFEEAGAASVNLLEFNATTGNFEQIAEQPVSQAGTYVFSDVETNNRYRVDVTVDGETGFATISDLQPGTNTRDIVVSNFTASGIYTVDNLSPADATVEPGAALEVTAEVTNDAGVADTQAVSFQVDGTTVATQNVTLDAGETTTVTFNVNAPSETGDYSHAIVTEAGSASGNLTVQSSSNNGGIVDQYDTDNNGEISLTELSAAATDYSQDQISLTELSQVATAYSS